AHHSIKARDQNAAVCIAIAGASQLLSPGRRTLEPFAQTIRPLINTSQSALETQTKSSTSMPLAPDAMETPVGTTGTDC
ncbi:hypothetical protein BGZ65_003589, partial [Modicella reniformis]